MAHYWQGALYLDWHEEHGSEKNALGKLQLSAEGLPMLQQVTAVPSC